MLESLSGVDAGLGALSYLLDALAGLMAASNAGAPCRGWLCAFGFFIIPPGVISIVLVILRAGQYRRVVYAVSGGIGGDATVVSPALDEVIATGQFLLCAKRERGHVWRAFWRGEDSAEEEPESLERRSRLSELLHSIEAFAAPSNLWVRRIGRRLVDGCAYAAGHWSGLQRDSTHITRRRWSRSR